MVSWSEREELVSYSEIDKDIDSYKNNLMEHCMGGNGGKLDIEYIRFLAGCVHALKQLKTNHRKEWEANMPPDPLHYRL